MMNTKGVRGKEREREREREREKERGEREGGGEKNRVQWKGEEKEI